MSDFVPAYDKRPDFELFVRGYVDAVGRATRLDQGAAEVGQAGRDPTTVVYRPTERIRSA